MRLGKFLTDRKSAILERWFDRTIKTYPEETARFLKSKKNRFANPVGNILFQELESRIDELTLLGFDIFMQCREKIYDLKANEINKRTVGVLKRAKLVVEEP